MATKAQLKKLEAELAKTNTGLGIAAESARISKESVERSLGREEAAANKEVIQGLRLKL
jgi:hypothetical protein